LPKSYELSEEWLNAFRRLTDDCNDVLITVYYGHRKNNHYARDV